MQQLLIDMATPQNEPTLSSFIVGKNHDLMRVLKIFQKRDPMYQFLYLWGEEASGKTHLLKALKDEKAKYILATDALETFQFEEGFDLYLVDDCEKLDEEKQIALFNLFNALKEKKVHLIVASRFSASALPLRGDVKSRMSWGLSYKIQQLSDGEKIAVIEQMAKDEGFSIAENVLPYLMKHYPRDMQSLMAMIKRLDQYALEKKRLITLPLLKEILAQNNN